MSAAVTMSDDQRRLVEEHYGLAQWLAWRHCERSAVDYDDCIGPAEEALCKAAMSWQGDGSFANYVSTGIRRAIAEEITNLYSVAYVPRRTREKVLMIKRLFGDWRFPSLFVVKKLFGYQKLADVGYRRLYMAWLVVCSPVKL